MGSCRGLRAASFWEIDRPDALEERNLDEISRTEQKIHNFAMTSAFFK